MSQGQAPCDAHAVNRRDWSEYASPPPRPVTRVVLMAEYVAPPLWTDHGPLTPEALGFSPELSSRIRDWVDEWEFGGGQESSEEEFAARGDVLAAEMRAALGPGVKVEYEP